MRRSDEAEIIRTLAYEIWEREGRPTGREHEHWADANREFARLYPAEPIAEISGNQRSSWDRSAAERQEADALRRALWTPEPFSEELFGAEESKATRWRRSRAALPGTIPEMSSTEKRL
ncbi:DUF2934 domain-containing protein [Aurantimonas endophytica]|uniref:DUF2934 domain-containing protein n=1 Tax=Aurantimonas endophytica TaxID=1522175 RepID=A0A7W6MPM7_9HYPH|nr:DUF2934 domain-containing protein [Aurantimonas endophytica]MBB4003165.1 hypothetical protein [Aurantimonas endophytica]MCO6404036.1 DUF2934 domain-containing protein [Aurantimonas endophytica]